MRILPALLLLLGSCASEGAPISGDSRNVGDLTVTFRVEPSRVRVGQTVRLTLSLQNSSGREATLEFGTAQRYDFRVAKGGRDVWQWSGDRAFAQVLGSETIAGQSVKRYAESWRPESKGTYRAFARVTTRGFGKELSGEVFVE